MHETETQRVVLSLTLPLCGYTGLELLCLEAQPEGEEAGGVDWLLIIVQFSY